MFLAGILTRVVRGANLIARELPGLEKLVDEVVGRRLRIPRMQLHAPLAPAYLPVPPVTTMTESPVS